MTTRIVLRPSKSGTGNRIVLTDASNTGLDLPGSPTGVSAFAGNAYALVTFTAPASDGGSPILGYRVTASSGQIVNQAGTSTAVVVTGLANGVPVTFTVRARNIVGLGPPSATSSPVTPLGTIVITGRSISILIRDPLGNIRPNLTGLKWSWFDEATPDIFTAPIDSGTNGSTNGAGVMTLLFPHSTLPAGGVGFLIATNSNGSPNQSPPPVSIAKPYTVD